MNYDWIRAETLEQLQPDAVQAWLKARGWRDQGAEGFSARAYAKEGGRPEDQVLLPTRPTAPDFKKFMGILVDKVAQVEQLGPEAVLNDLSAAGYDVFRVRVLNADDGSIELNNALSLVQQSRATLQAAARAAASKTPRRSYLGRQAEIVTSLLEHVRLGQTDRGSFVVPLYVPYAFDTADTNAILEGFGRQVTRKLSSGLEGIDKALGLISSTEPAAPFAEAAHLGVSADLCQSLGKLLSEIGDIEFTIRWAAAQPEERGVTRVEFSDSSAQSLLRVAHLLKEQDPPPPEPIIGFVTRLDDKAGGLDGKMIINGPVDNRWRNIELILEEHFRADAAKAFADRLPVIVEGELKRIGSKIIMPHVKFFEISKMDEEGGPN